MTKRSVDGYRPTGIRLDHDDADAHVFAWHAARLLTIVDGSRPGKFQIEYMAARLSNAARLYDWDTQQAYRPTPVQLVEEYSAIQTAAARLLLALGSKDGNVDAMPYAVRDGLEKQARADAPERLSELEFSLFESVQLRRAVDGVASLRRWAEAACKAEEAAAALQPRSPARNTGNEALNEFIRSVVFDAWVETVGLHIKGNARMIDFVVAAVSIVGVTLEHDAARERVRSIFAETFKRRSAVKSAAGKSAAI